jgi:hypothetical protein
MCLAALKTACGEEVVQFNGAMKKVNLIVVRLATFCQSCNHSISNSVSHHMESEVMELHVLPINPSSNLIHESIHESLVEGALGRDEFIHQLHQTIPCPSDVGVDLMVFMS